MPYSIISLRNELLRRPPGGRLAEVFNGIFFMSTGRIGLVRIVLTGYRMRLDRGLNASRNKKIKT